MYLERKYFTGTLFFYAKFIQRNCLMKFKKENEDFLDYKNIKLKTLQNSHFSKEVSPWFLSKNWHFSNYCYYAKWIEKKSMKKF